MSTESAVPEQYPGVIPTSVEELTPAWLTAALHAHGQRAVVRAVEAAPVGSGQMAGSYRLTLAVGDGDGTLAVGDGEGTPAVHDGAVLPATLVAKLAVGPEEHRRFGSGAFRNEVRFYRDLAATVQVPVPRCHVAVASESGAEFVLLLDDLAPATQGDQILGCTVAQARAVAVSAAGLHAPRWDDPTLLEVPGLSLPTEEDRVLMDSVLAPMAEDFSRRFADRLGERERATLAWLVDTAGDWLVTPPSHYALLHGDLRIDNVMFGADATVTIVDWQTISPGQPLRDIAFLLSTSLTVEDRRACEQEILADYHRALLAHGVTGYGLDECVRDYVGSLIHAPLIIVFGCGAAAPTERGDRMFLTMLERGAAAVADLLPEALAPYRARGDVTG